MLFNSLIFFLFLPIVFILYWFVLNRNLKVQNLFIAIASYVFYGWWDWRFLFLIFASTVVDYLCGLAIANKENKKDKRIFLIISMVFNLGLLGFFKYYNFFVDSIEDSLLLMGVQWNTDTLNVLLPVGISFYTFQTMSYTIDIYRGKLEPTKDFIAFTAFVSFFPQLVAGPIERASNLLPQFYEKRKVNYARLADGGRQILWGFFKKVVVADNCAILVNKTFELSDYSALSGVTLWIAIIFFAFQIYCDFSGYSDIAIGLAKWFGFDLKTNFRTPYFTRDIPEFWRRWHMSLTTWFRDYVYIPLGGSKVSKYKSIRNILIVFLVSGFWHGANWTFVIWGLLNFIYYIPSFIVKKNRKNTDDLLYPSGLPSLKEFGSILLTFALVCIAWVFFRAENVARAGEYIQYMFANINYHPGILLLHLKEISIYYILILILVEYKFRNRKHPFEISNVAKPIRWVAYIVLFYVVLFNLQIHEKAEFIYFQF